MGDSSECLYLYAIADHPPQWDRRGVGGAPIQNVAYRELAAVVSPIDRSTTISPTAKELWLHEEIIEELLSCCAVLPVRFGVVLAGEGAVLAALQTHYEQFAATLDHVRGRVELGLRVLWSSEGAPASPPEQPRALDSGRAYLLSRLEREHQLFAWQEKARVLADPIHSTLATLASDSVHQFLETPRLLLTAAYLLDREQVAGFQEALQALQSAYSNLHFLCTGPWPAYSFARIAIRTEEGAR